MLMLKQGRNCSTEQLSQLHVERRQQCHCNEIRLNVVEAFSKRGRGQALVAKPRHGVLEGSHSFSFTVLFLEQAGMAFI